MAEVEAVTDHTSEMASVPQGEKRELLKHCNIIDEITEKKCVQATKFGMTSYGDYKIDMQTSSE